jgi:hypothetical protein
MNYRIQLILLIVTTSFSSAAQKFNLIFETGVERISCDEDKEYDYLRSIPESYSNYYDPYSSAIESNMTRAHAAVKVERLFLPKLAFATGIRYTYLQSHLKKNQSPQYFYLLFRQTGTTTEYLTVRDIEQRANYIGIPLEVRYSPFSGHLFNLFCTVGSDVNVRVLSSNSITFNDENMREYESDVSGIVGSPDEMFVSAYGKFGVMIGRTNPRASVSAMLPIYLPQGSSSLVQPVAGVGINVQFIKTF